jgi:hypothetical protein
MVDGVELTAGNFDAAYGGFSVGLLETRTRSPVGTQGIHGEAHVDLFDFSGAIRGPSCGGSARGWVWRGCSTPAPTTW